MKKNYTLLIVVFSYISVCFSQKETDKWYYAGSPAPAIDFSSGTPVSLNNSGITFSHESGTSLSDAAGNLLFYADGNSICFNKNHVAMTNGTGLIMHNSVTQGCIFVPKPGSTTIYYLFHIGVPNLGLPPFNLYYSEIDMTLSGGLGAITINKNIQIAASFGNCAEKMTVTKHCNGIDYWVMVHDYVGSAYKAYLVTANGINTTPVISNIGAVFANPTGMIDAVGQMKFSPNGIKLATIVAGQGFVEILDFNKTTGVLSNPLNLGAAGTDFPYGVEFSPDNSKVYACGQSNPGNPSLLKQWDLCAGSAAAVVASGIGVGTNVAAFSLQMAPDGKIYGAKWSTTLLGINNPNVAGIGCGYVANAINTSPGSSTLGLPNFSTHYFNKPATYSNATTTTINTTNCQNNGMVTAAVCPVFGISPFTYEWSTGAIEGPTVNLTSTISSLAPGNYSVIISDATCMKDTITFTINGGGSNPITQNVIKCNGSGYTLPGGTTVFTSGNYHDTLISMGGCDSIINTNLTFTSVLTSTISPVICYGGIYTLPGGATVNSSGTYYDTLSTVNNCDSIVTTNLTIAPALTNNFNAAICAGNNYTLPNGNIVNVAGTWVDTLVTTGGCDSIVTTNLSVITPANFSQNISICSGNNYVLPNGSIVNITGTYVDTINTATICDSIVTTHLTVLPKSNSNQISSICSNQSYMLPSGILVNVSGTYTSILTAANGCDSIVTTSLTVNPLPTVNISSNVTIAIGNSTILNAGGGTNYLWSPSTGLNNTTGNTVTATPLLTTEYCVYVNNSYGCVDSACVLVRVETPCPLPENLVLPNAFSPNNDGENDEFCLQGWGNCSKEFSIGIFDRWGTKVFESKDPTFCWDGQYKGNVLDAGVFVYYLIAKNQNIDSIIKKTGNISLIR